MYENQRHNRDPFNGGPEDIEEPVTDVRILSCSQIT